jgi:hypothetical protein
MSEESCTAAAAVTATLAVTPEQVDAIKAQLAAYAIRGSPSTASEAMARSRSASVERELGAWLDTLINAPVSGGRGPFEWLPDELIVMIMLMLPFEVLWSGVCERVCLRWARLMKSAPVTRRKREGRWAAYEAGAIKPRELAGHTNPVCALAVGLDGKIYSGSADNTIRVWSGDDGTHLQTLVGHTRSVWALTVGLDGKVYSGSWDGTIRVWSGDDGTHLQTLEGHTRRATALAVGLDGKVYSGSWDTTVRVWSGDDGRHLQTLEGHTNYVCSLAVGLYGKVYSGSNDGTIRVWSGVDGAHLQTLANDAFCALAVGLDGKLFSSSYDGTIRMWSCNGCTRLHTIEADWIEDISNIAFGRNGAMFTCSYGSSHNLLMW